MTTLKRLSDVIVEMAQEQGFFLPEAPETNPTLPEDLTVISGNELMRLMKVFTELIAYASSQEAIANGQAKAMAARYKQARAQRYLELKGAGGKVTEKQLDYELDADEELVEYRKQEVLSDNYVRLVQAVLSGYEGKYALLSRELTRRSQDWREGPN